MQNSVKRYRSLDPATDRPPADYNFWTSLNDNPPISNNHNSFNFALKYTKFKMTTIREQNIASAINEINSGSTQYDAAER